MRSTDWTVGTRQALAASAAKSKDAASKAKLGSLPEWKLTDLYPSVDAPRLSADLKTADQAADVMHERYCGKLAKVADGGKEGAALVGADREFEALSDIMGRIVSYASLLYAADTADPTRQKFFGDIQEKITAISSKLLFFPLELNRIDRDGRPPSVHAPQQHLGLTLTAFTQLHHQGRV